MPRPKKPAAEATAPIPVRFSKKLRDELKRVSAEREVKQQDLIRQAAEVGLIVLARTGYDDAEAIARYAFQLSADDREELERLKLSIPAKPRPAAHEAKRSASSS